MTDVDLSAVNRRESRRTFLILVQTFVIAALAIAVLALAARLDTGVDLLEERTPIIQRIEELERENLCLAAADLRFLGSIVSTLNIPLDERQAVVEGLVEAVRRIDAALSAGDDPCNVQLPPIGDP